VRERQQILRLVVKEVLVDGDTITLRHSIPIPPADAGTNRVPPSSAGPPGAAPAPDYLLRSGRRLPAARQPLHAPLPQGVPSGGARPALRGAARELRR
jgi:site-specific DNA recombinase